MPRWGSGRRRSAKTKPVAAVAGSGPEVIAKLRWDSAAWRSLGTTHPRDSLGRRWRSNWHAGPPPARRQLPVSLVVRCWADRIAKAAWPCCRDCSAANCRPGWRRWQPLQRRPQPLRRLRCRAIPLRRPSYRRAGMREHCPARLRWSAKRSAEDSGGATRRRPIGFAFGQRSSVREVFRR